MNIRILQGIYGASQAKGLAVVIDVFRAFSVECYLMEAGAGCILPVGSKETAYRLKEEHPDYVLVGERHGMILPGFDFGNSPSQISGAVLTGRTIVHTTSAGTQGIVAASKGAGEILTGSLVNARAIASYIKKRDPEEVSIICMGLEAVEESPEDTLCGEYIKALLEERELDMEQGLKAVREHREGRKFFNPETQHIFPEQDFYMSTDLDRFDFVLRVEQVGPDIFRSVRV